MIQPKALLPLPEKVPEKHENFEIILPDSTNNLLETLFRVEFHS